MKHLWECDHPYYCSEENYFRGRSETVAEYDSWAGWLNLNLGMDVDYNLIFRWDWKPIDEDGGHPKDDAAMDILDDNPDCKIRRLMGLEAWAAKHNLLKPDGTPREIIGTLPVTADGVIVANQFERSVSHTSITVA